tara:strand:- start:31 stop:276 length:246 start_codon:yes stop_codon:yes gene_type:complete
MDIFNEILWSQFQKLERVSKLTLNEQVNEYNLYLNELKVQRITYLQKLNSIHDTRGGAMRYVLNEDGSYLLDEDGNKIEYY